MPLLYNSWWAYGWQLERKVWKEGLITDRTSKLSQEAKVTSIDDIPLGKMQKEEFDDKWLYKPVKIRGLFDHEKEVFVSRTRDGDRAYEVITPLYTRVEKKTGDLHGIIVNRGRIPFEYKDSKMHLTPPNQEQEVEGVLFYSEGEDQYTKAKFENKWKKTLLGSKESSQTSKESSDNKVDVVEEETPLKGKTTKEVGEIRINLDELIQNTDLSNTSFASQIYLKSVNLTLDGKIE